MHSIYESFYSLVSVHIIELLAFKRELWRSVMIWLSVRSLHQSRARIYKPFKEPRIWFQPGGPVRQPYFLPRPTRLNRMTESIPRNLFLGSLNVYKYGLWVQSQAFCCLHNWNMFGIILSQLEMPQRSIIVCFLCLFAKADLIRTVHLLRSAVSWPQALYCS